MRALCKVLMLSNASSPMLVHCPSSRPVLCSPLAFPLSLAWPRPYLVKHYRLACVLSLHTSAAATLALRSALRLCFFPFLSVSLSLTSFGILTCRQLPHEGMAVTLSSEGPASD